MGKAYSFRKSGLSGKYEALFSYIPGRWLSTDTTDINEAILWAEAKLKEDMYDQDSNNDITLEQFAGDFFSSADPYKIRDRDKQYGKHYEEDHYFKCNGFMNNYILPKFGCYKIAAISDVAIENWFLALKDKRTGLPLATDTKNKCLNAFIIVLNEAHRQGIVAENEAAKVQRTTVTNVPRGYFTPEEMSIMFPEDDDKLIRIWGDLFWATYFLITRDTGFRPGEVSALSIDNYLPEVHGFYSTHSVDFRKKTLKGIKTRYTGQKYKVGLLTSQTERFIQKRIEVCRKKNENYLFLVNGNFISCDKSNKRFVSRFPAEIVRGNRTQYCLRHSFETDLAGRVENKVLAELMAHTQFRKEYDHRTPEKILQQLQPVRELLENRKTEL